MPKNNSGRANGEPPRGAPVGEVRCPKMDNVYLRRQQMMRMQAIKNWVRSKKLQFSKDPIQKPSHHKPLLSAANPISPIFTSPPPETEPTFTAPPPETEPTFTAPPPETEPAFTAPPPETEPAFTSSPSETELTFTPSYNETVPARKKKPSLMIRIPFTLHPIPTKVPDPTLIPIPETPPTAESVNQPLWKTHIADTVFQQRNKKLWTEKFRQELKKLRPATHVGKFRVRLLTSGGQKVHVTV
ncbi:unnamed protein product [Ceutorhynchus assimilis]|uniref:Uncharacterized protein n=1 Tax=Ceutorhynchus assimilis TaxID=467358 RepID=A0A9P0GP00_9CUCU|nr:unnamed protein product [Ceutorhynchus assimilis]